MERFVKELEYCTYCPKMCRHSCPVGAVSGNETLTPQSKMELLNMLRRGAVPWDREHVQPLYGCTACRRCQQYCEHDIEVAAVLQEGRARAEKLRLSHAALQRLPEEHRARSAQMQERLHDEFSSHLFADEAQVGYLPGCETVECFIDDIRDTFTVFDSLNLNFIRLMDDISPCAGYPLWAGGHLDAARFAAKEAVQVLRKFHTVVVGSPTCTWLLREKLPAEGFAHDTEVLHISEYLHVHAERLDIRRTKPAAFFQDPCYLGRYLGVYDPPRRLIARCVDSPMEFFYNRDEAECCGGGGLLPKTYPEVATGQATKRLAEAELFEVPLVITACPDCKRTFLDSGTEVEVMDLVNLLAWCLRDPNRRALADE